VRDGGDAEHEGDAEQAEQEADEIDGAVDAGGEQGFVAGDGVVVGVGGAVRAGGGAGAGVGGGGVGGVVSVGAGAGAGADAGVGGGGVTGLASVGVGGGGVGGVGGLRVASVGVGAFGVRLGLGVGRDPVVLGGSGGPRCARLARPGPVMADRRGGMGLPRAVPARLLFTIAYHQSPPERWWHERRGRGRPSP
jgi:hypothetical protein